MKYLKCFHGKDEWKEISKAEAVFVVLRTYNDNPAIRGMLEREGEIRCLYSTIKVISDSTMRV